MATTVSLLKAGPVLWKHKVSSQKAPYPTNPRQFSKNFFLKFESSSRNSRTLSIISTSSPSLNSPKLQVVTTTTNCKLKNYNKGPSSSSSSSPSFEVYKLITPIHKLLSETLFRKLWSSLLLSGLLVMMAMTLGFRDTAALASSNCRMDGSSKSSSSHSYGSGRRSSQSYPSYSYGHDDPLDWYFAALTALLYISLFIRMDMMSPPALGSVLMIQVGMLDKERVLQRKLNRIAETADTSTSQGLQYVLNESSRALLQHYDSCHFAYFLERRDQSMGYLKPRYRYLSIRERGRYDKEIFTNVDGVKVKSTTINTTNSIENEYTVVTILLLVRGGYSSPDLVVESVFDTFCSIPAGKIESVEVLWTPQSEDETV